MSSGNFSWNSNSSVLELMCHLLFCVFVCVREAGGLGGACMCQLQEILFFLCIALTHLLEFQVFSSPFSVIKRCCQQNFVLFWCVYSVFSQWIHLVKPQKLLKCIVVPVEQPNIDLPSMAIGRKKHIPKTTQVSSDCRHWLLCKNSVEPMCSVPKMTTWRTNLELLWIFSGHLWYKELFTETRQIYFPS